MRTSSMVLGIIGGALSLLLALVLVLLAVTFINISPFTQDFSSPDTWEPEYSFSYDSSDLDNIDLDLPDSFNGDIASTATNIAGGVIIGMAVIAFIAGVLGLVGGLIVNKRNTASGVMMIIAAVLSLISYFNIVSMTLFIIGAVMALKKQSPPYQSYPPYQYGQPPYPPYPPYPQVQGNAPAPPANPQAPADNSTPPTHPQE